ncbi:sensor histidine kinase [Cellulomonas sp. URHE0023]|uniref:sensor histidine kinase n=1 Tax=Cellulomonas sp. URHE0023 TaxID=1380354 RepID=UPI0012DED5CC|nr:histidine kinase [Cellulomonas sp. URHE0023]
MRLRLAFVCWCAAVGILVAVPLAATVDAADVPDVPSFGDVAWWCGLAVVTVQAALLARQRTAPRATVVLVAAGAPVGAALGLQSALGITSVAIIVATFLAVLSESAERLWPVLAYAAALVALGETWEQLDTGYDLGTSVLSGIVQGVGTVGVAALVGLVVRSRRDARTAREERASALVREHEALVEVAVAKERTAMARELHDIAAHHLSGIAVMTGAIGRQIDVDPEGAKRAVQEVRQQSREMLGDLRALVGLLREEPAGLSTGAAAEAGVFREESLGGIAGLVETARRAGSDVTLTAYDRPDGPPPGARTGPLAQLSAYRTVQEALANATRHAPGARCEVVVDARDRARTVVTVRNAAPSNPTSPVADGGGFGLIGMRERAELTGAELEVGPTPDGGWLVTLSIPTSDDAETPGESR